MHDESTQTGGCVSTATRDESECTVMLNMVRLLTQKHLWSKPREMGRDGPAGPVRCDSGRTRGTQRENQRDAHNEPTSIQFKSIKDGGGWTFDKQTSDVHKEMKDTNL